MTTSSNPYEDILQHPVLVLNKAWVPIDTVPVRDAISSVCGDKARIVHPETYQLFNMEEWFKQEIPSGEKIIRTASSPIRVPEVIVNSYNKIPVRKVVFSRRNLWKRDAYTCQYCGCKPAQDEITIDHVIPRSVWLRQNHKEPVTSFKNCVLACLACNIKKNNRTPEQAGMRLKKMVKGYDGGIKPEYYYRPKVPQWSPLYATRKFEHVPDSWSSFVQGTISEMYWTVQLED